MHRVALAALVLALAVAGCSEDDAGSSASPVPAAVPSQTPTVEVPPDRPPPQEVEPADLVTGTGPPVSRGDRVAVHFRVAAWSSGEIVESTYGRAPFQLVVGDGGEIPGFENGLVGMRAGGRRQLLVPADQAYGDREVGAIPAADALVFVVDLLEILE